MKTIDLDREQAVSRMRSLHERMEQLQKQSRMSPADDQEFTEAAAEFDALADHVRAWDRRAEISRAAGEGGGGLAIDRGVDAYRGRDIVDERRFGGQRESALRQLERSVKGGLPARSAEVVEQLLQTGPEVSQSWVSRWVTETGSDVYRSAFSTLVVNGEARAALLWTPAERAAFERVSRLKSERAMSLTDSAGGFLVPFELDPTIAIVNAGSTAPMLQISRVVSTYTDLWHGVSAAGVQASWDAEASEVSDDSPVLGEPEVPCLKMQAFVPFSVELQGDAVALVSEIGKLLADGALQLLNSALTVGSGVGEPTGIVTALAGGSSVVTTGAAGTLTAADVYATQNALGPRWQANARWVGNLATLNALRQMESGNGSLLFPELRASEPTLLGRPVHEASVMDNTVATGKNVLVYGDWQNYLISQRVGSSVELVPHLFGSNRRPTGQRGMLLWARWGADSINDSGFRMLQVA
ncbi:phage major capsid protein [Mycobacterium europaeum]|uniref:phage major capsid protein n=1 Tax=Mycobacterium europaeum TaxID=761804 RepID=UPI002AE01D6C|nr:phage major capsid protein [Mycobacterium europaeum]MEA1159426.1 phage major capsid protein [Mycobacterium europaeum]